MNIRTSPKVANLGLSAPEAQHMNESDFAWTTAFRAIRRRFWIIVLITLAVCVAALPPILSLKKTYYAETRVLMSPTRVTEMAGDGYERVEELDVAIEIERLLSREISTSVIERFDLDERPEFNPDLREKRPLALMIARARAAILPPAAAPATEADDATDSTAQRVLREYRNALVVDRPGNFNVLTIGFVSLDPKLAAAVPNAVAELYLERSDAVWQSEIDTAAAWLDQRIRAERQRVADGRAAIEAFRSEVGVDTSGADTENADRLGVLTVRRSELAQERFDLSAALASVDAAKADLATPALNEPSVLQGLRRELQQEERELETISGTYGENYSGVVFRKNRIDTIRVELSDELAVYGRSLELRDTALEAEETAILSQMATLRDELSEQRRAGPELDRMRDTVRAQEDALSLLEYRYQNLMAERLVSPVSLDVLAPATVPVRPSGTSRRSYLMAAALAGLALALTVAALIELRDKSIRSHEQLGHLDLLRPIGLLHAPSRRERQLLPQTIRERIETPLTERLREALFMLECDNQERLPSSILVSPAETGGHQGDVAEWLGMELLAEGHRVLLVDARLEEQPQQALVGPARQRPFCHDIQRDPETGLARLTLRSDTPRGAAFGRALRELQAHADSIGCVTVYRGPPLHRAATMQIAKVAERTILTLRWGHTTRHVVELIAGLVGKAGVGPVASLIVDVNTRRHRQYGFSDRLTLTAETSSRNTHQTA
ncbi:hypothetical protein [Tranquillimonas rosea]|uniref:hypothetical protein n=1 Tax=Tranquillimonas rosea TaxID=641238 RepID=UPI003BAB9FC7